MEKFTAAEDITYNTLESMDFKKSQALINEVIEQFPPQRKCIFKMSREQGLSHEQITQELDISKNQDKNQIIEYWKDQNLK